VRVAVAERVRRGCGAVAVRFLEPAVAERPQAQESGSEDAKRLPSVQEIEDFLLAIRTLRVLITSRESFALPNDLLSWRMKGERAERTE